MSLSHFYKSKAKDERELLLKQIEDLKISKDEIELKLMDVRIRLSHRN